MYKEAKKVIPGGVNSPVRAFKAVGGSPIFASMAKGAYLYDEDGNRFIDYISSWGPMILGHAQPKVLKSITKVVKNGTSFGMPTELETKLAKLALSMVPKMDKIRFVNSGTEACMSAIRLARGFTKRDKIIKFSGCYHGHSDSFLIEAGSGVITFGEPNSPGVTKGTAKRKAVPSKKALPTKKPVSAKKKVQNQESLVKARAFKQGSSKADQDAYLRQLASKSLNL